MKTKLGSRKVYPTNTRHQGMTPSREGNYCVNEMENQSRPMRTCNHHRNCCILS
ncbi:hypothetical protein BPJM79_10513 [Bacillus pumilus]